MPLAVEVIDIISPLDPQVWGRAADNYLSGDADGVRWTAGLKFVPRGRPRMTSIATSDPCALYTFVAAEGYESELAFTVFEFQERLTCSAIGGWSQEEISEWTRVEAQAAFSAALAKQAMYGSYGATALPDLYNTRTQLANASTALEALAIVEDGLAVRSLGRRMMIHVSPGILTRLVAAGAVTMRNGQWVSPTGHYVVADAGYLPDPVASQSTIFGSAPIHYASNGITLRGDYTTFDFVHDDIEAFASGHAIVWFETAFTVSSTVTGVNTVPAVT